MPDAERAFLARVLRDAADMLRACDDGEDVERAGGISEQVFSP